MTTFALVSESKDISNKDLYLLSLVMQENAKHCANAYGLATPAIICVDSFEELRQVKDVHPIVMMDKTDGDYGALGYHWWDIFRDGPSSRVFVPSCSGFNSGFTSVVEVCSHELVESMTDPQVNIWKEFPGQKGLLMAYEIADMTQEHYEVTMFGDKWRLSDFVLPAYWESRFFEGDNLKRFLQNGGKFSYTGTIRKPGEIRPSGYAIVRDANTGAQYPVYGDTFKSKIPEVAAAKSHPWSRSRLRGLDINRKYH